MDYITGPPAGELENRIKKLQSAMQRDDIGGALVVQKTDLFYFSGTSQQGWLYIPAEGNALLCVFKDFDRAKTESALKNVISLLSPKKIPQALSDSGYVIPSKLGMELDVLPANLFFQYSSIFGSSEIVDVSAQIRIVRAIKSPYEMEKMQKAAALSDMVAARVPGLLEVGKTELALAGELEAYARSLGHQGIVRMRLFDSGPFYGNLLSGPSAAAPSYLASPSGGEGTSAIAGQGADYKTLQRNETILVDYVFALDGYIADHARIFVMGELSDQLYRAHDDMLKIQDRIKTLAIPGCTGGDLYENMVTIATDMGYGDNFMGVGERRIRFTGHGVGLELDEYPFIAKGQTLPLEEGMVIALEPKLIFPGKGVVGIKNTHRVAAAGLEPLTRFQDTIYTVS